MRFKPNKKLVAIGCLLVLIAVLFAPNIVAPLMKGNIERRLTEETGLSVQIGSLSAGWFSSIRVQEIAVETNSGQPFVNVSEVRTDKNLLGLLFRDKEVGKVHIKAPHVRLPLEGSMKTELEQAIAQIDPSKGILRQIVNPDRDAIVELLVSEGRVDVRTADTAQWHTTMSDLGFQLNIDHTPTLDTVDVVVPRTAIQLAPELCDFGLKFVAPVLAGAVDLDGQGTIEIAEGRIQPQKIEEMTLEGNLIIEEAYADIQAELIVALAGIIGRDETEPAGSEPLILQVADGSDIHFNVADGKIHHEGLRFGMTDVLPNTLLTSNGDVGFDETLDFTVGLEIPFEHMGEGPLLKEIGTPSLSIPVTGTFENPEVGIGKGKAVGSLIRDVVRSATDDKVDPAPLLEKIGELGLLKGRKGKSAAGENDGPDDLNQTEPAEPNMDSNTSPDEAESPAGRGRLLDRLRNRSKRRSDTPPEE